MGFSNLKISSRLAIAFGVVTALLLMIVTAGIIKLSVLHDNTTQTNPSPVAAAPSQSCLIFSCISGNESI